MVANGSVGYITTLSKINFIVIVHKILLFNKLEGL